MAGIHGQKSFANIRGPGVKMLKHCRQTKIKGVISHASHELLSVREIFRDIQRYPENK